MSSEILNIGKELFNLSTIENFLINSPQINLVKEAQERIIHSRKIVEQVAKGNIPVYGINTGFGKLASQIISSKDLAKLQQNLIRSHSVGAGRELKSIEIRIAILLLINSLSKGCSGVRLNLVESLIRILNSKITPVVYEYGSLGASGDLVPLAHVVLSLLNENPVRNKNGNLFKKLSDIDPDLVINGLEAKEGLALINGTHFTTALTAIYLIKFIKYVIQSLLSFSFAVDALQASIKPFREEIHSIRPHPGQIQTAKVMESLLSGSQIVLAHEDPVNDPRVQDPYSYRCFPQIMGGIIHVIGHCRYVIEIELNSVTDNPVITPNGEILSGGNFHSEPVAFVADYLGIAVTKMMNVMEKQVEKLLNPATNFNLPAFLTESPGLNSGYMIAHYTLAGLVNRSRLLSHPSSVDNVSVSANQEDHVSMGMNAALKFKEAVLLYEDILALHFIMTSQGLSLRKEMTQLKSSQTNEKILYIIRKTIPKLVEDRPLYKDLNKMKELIQSGIIFKEHGSGALYSFNKWLLTGLEN